MIPYFIKKIFSDNLKRDIKQQLGVPSLYWSLQNIKRLGFTSLFALDIGAYEGEWAATFSAVFDEAKVLMIEAQSQKKDKLERLSTINKNLSYHIALLSSHDGKRLHFIENETASHVTGFSGLNTREVTSESMDEIIKRKEMPYPDFLKLDVQGFEIEVLNGATNCLTNATFCLLEVTLIDLGFTSLVLEVMNYMDKYGFQLYDITQLMRRPFDKALYQSDFLFIRKTASLLSAKTWN